MPNSPRPTRHAPHLTPASGDVGAGTQLDVLLVEDSPDDVELALHALRKHPFAKHVHVCRDGVEALDYLFGEGSSPVPPRLILLDFKMPRLNGLEVLERVRAEERTKRAPVIMLTASDEAPDMARSYDLGANSYIVKPVDFHQFSDTILQLGQYWLLLNRLPDKSESASTAAGRSDLES